MRLAYADPPYPGCAHLYRDHPDFDGEVDHPALVERLLSDYPDGWALSTSSTALREIWNLCPDARVAVWTKGFAAFKNQRITFAWEPVLYMARGGTAEPERGVFVRDWVNAMPPVFVGKGLGVAGQKPIEFCFWLFDLLGLRPDDELHDLYPGSGAVTQAWTAFRSQLRLAPRDQVTPQAEPLALDIEPEPAARASQDPRAAAPAPIREPSAEQGHSHA